MRIVRCLLLVVLSAAPAFAQSADTVLTNGKIVATGKSDEIMRLAGPATRRIDLGGRTVIPGLIDSHMRAIRAALFYATEVNWIGTRSVPEAMERIRAKAKAAKSGEWIIVAGGWTQSASTKNGPRPASQETPVTVITRQSEERFTCLTPLLSASDPTKPYESCDLEA